MVRLKEHWCAGILVRALAIAPLIATAVSLLASGRLFASTSGVGESEAYPRTELLSTQLPKEPTTERQGSQVSFNGTTMSIPWSQWGARRETGEINITTWISDAGLMQLIGLELLDTDDATIQPVRWFSDPILVGAGSPTPVLATRINGGYRYLDITDLAIQSGWQLSVDGDTLQITAPLGRVEEIRFGQQPWGDRIVLNLDRPTSWQVTTSPIEKTPQPEDPNPEGVQKAPEQQEQPMQELAVTIDARVDPSAMRTLAEEGQKSSGAEEQGSGGAGELRSSGAGELRSGGAQGATGEPTVTLPQSLSLEKTGLMASFQTLANKTTISIQLPASWRPRVWTQPNPRRLIIDIRPDFVAERDILWAPGLRWRQRLVSLGTDQFSVVWLEVNLNGSKVSLRPINSQPATMVGIAQLSQIAQQEGAAAAINGGFFNRNTQQPLGAIRLDGRWLSSPILNRGAIAWNDAGLFKIGRLSFQETLSTSAGAEFPVLFLNSGYPQAGISRYTTDWGPTYTPLNDNETIVVVDNTVVTSVTMSAGAAGKTAFPIPPTGYLLVLRSFRSAADALPIGTSVRIKPPRTVPLSFTLYPQILGAGPVLLRNGQIVLDAPAEKFSDNFTTGKASRSAIGITGSGKIIIAAVHNRINGPGATLTEIAQLMQELGAVDALNLDGGGSTTLYLGGQLLEHPPRIVPRVHNGLGIFLGPSQ